MYDHAFRFFRHLSVEWADLPGGRALANTQVPLLLSNAAWYPQPGELVTLAKWYAERDLNAAVVVPAKKDARLEQTLREGPFMLESSFGFTKLLLPLFASSGTFVEQVNWAQGRALGETLAAAYNMPEYGLAMGATLTSAMQADPALLAYIAYRDHQPNAAAVAYADAGRFSVMMISDPRPLNARLLQEAQSRKLEPDLFTTLEPEGTGTGGLERWSIR